MQTELRQPSGAQRQEADMLFQGSVLALLGAEAVPIGLFSMLLDFG
jgi:hypothetical protein